MENIRRKVREIRKKEMKTPEERMLIQYHEAMAFISEVLVEESKLHYSSEDAIEKIREYLCNHF